MPRSMRIVAAAALLAIGFSACGGQLASSLPATPSTSVAVAVPDKPVTLRVANGEGPGSPESDAVLYFADEVARASGGTVTVEPVDDEQADVDNDNRVASGEIDAAITQARSWDALDVTSLQALQTPFLITNEAIAAAATDGDIAEQLISGLPAKGVDGLALWAIDFRHPVSFGEPYLSLADFKGTKIRIVGSTITEAVMAALGAEAVRPDGEWSALVKDGTIKGAESAFDRVSTLPQIGTMTGNVTFYPRVDAFFINHAVFAKLSATQQAAIRDAASATRKHVIDGIVPDSEQAAGYCSDSGGTVVLADEADLAAMATALQPVRAKLQEDALTKQLIADITKVAAGVADPASVAACAPPAGDAASAIPAGTYTTVATKEDALRIPWDDDCALKLDGGHITLELDGRTWTESESCKDHPISVGSHGTYTSTADTFVLKDCCDGSASTFTWQLDGTKLTLRLTDVADGDESTERVIKFLFDHQFERGTP